MSADGNAPANEADRLAALELAVEAMLAQAARQSVLPDRWLAELYGTIVHEVRIAHITGHERGHDQVRAALDALFARARGRL